MTTVQNLKNETYSGDLRIDSLLDTSADWNYLLPARNTLYYTFALSSQLVSAAPATPTAFNAQQKASAVSILSHAASLTGINFVEVSSGATADIHFAACNIPSAQTSGLAQIEASWSTSSSNQLVSYSADVYVYLDNVEHFSANNTPTQGGQGYETLLHEIGHALGLGHPFDNLYTLPASQDNTNNTVMSYTSAGADKSTFQSYDVLALKWIYGEDGLGGNYGYNSTYGSLLASTTMGSAGNDALRGTSANESFTGLGGNDSIDGGAGRDTAHYTGVRSSFTVTQTASGLTVRDNVGGEGTDTLQNIERVQFSDKGIAFDIAGNAGQVYRLYQAAFNRTPDSGGLGDWIYGMDTGLSLLDVSSGFFNSAEFKSVYGQNPGNEEVVTRFYQNVLHRAPEQAGFDYWINQIESGLQTRTQVLTGFSESPENQAQLIGILSAGIEYTLHQV